MTRHRRQEDYFQITHHHRRYDKRTGKFIINIRYKTKTDITPRTIVVAEAFGLGIDDSQRHILYNNVQLKIGPTDIVYITGESGSGKSALLKALEKDITQGMHQTTININQIQPDPDKPIIETVGKTTQEALELLSRVGLNDAFLFLRRYNQLSDGQRYRYKIAKLIETNAQFWILDEFCSTLDRDTAKTVAYNVQKLARQHRKAVLAATTHTDLLTDLQPSVHIHKRFGKEIQTHYHPNAPLKQCTLLKQIQIEQGTKKDYNTLANFHYRSHHVGAIRKIFRALRNNEACGVIVYTYPAPATSGRRKILPKMPIIQLNQKLTNIMRVVVHPKYRTIGLGQKLVHETLDKCGTPYVETTAVMAKYNPFFEHAGMTKIQESTPSKQAQAIQETLIKLGFNTTLLSSQKHVTTQLKQLTKPQLSQLKQAFTKNPHPRFLKEFFNQQPYGKHELYNKKCKPQDQTDSQDSSTSRRCYCKQKSTSSGKHTKSLLRKLKPTENFRCQLHIIIESFKVQAHEAFKTRANPHNRPHVNQAHSNKRRHHQTLLGSQKIQVQMRCGQPLPR